MYKCIRKPREVIENFILEIETARTVIIIVNGDQRICCNENLRNTHKNKHLKKYDNFLVNI